MTSKTELSQFFRDLCTTELCIDDVQKLEMNIPLILCKLEHIFSPSFFDVMEHLPVHVPYEAIMCGPVQYRWMYLFERFLHDLKGMVKNRARVEGSISKAYLVQEISYFSSYYFEDGIQSRSTRKRRNETYIPSYENLHTLSVCKKVGRASGKMTSRLVNDNKLKAASLHILSQCDEVVPFIELFNSSIRDQYPGLEESVLKHSFDANFTLWFHKYMRGRARDRGKMFARDDDSAQSQPPVDPPVDDSETQAHAG